MYQYGVAKREKSYISFKTLPLYDRGIIIHIGFVPRVNNHNITQ